MKVPQYYIETNPAFVLLSLENDMFIFYNSIRHLGCKLNKLELKLLDTFYKYRNKEFILNKIQSNTDIVEKALSKITKLDLLNTDPAVFKEEDLSQQIPSSLYLHLTYNCNLACTYCYNRDIRKYHRNEELSLEQWKAVIDKMLPHIASIVFTGGECFLSKTLSPLIQYLREEAPKIKLSLISNGMHDFSLPAFKEILCNIDVINLSCDSISREGERKGFDPLKFRNNIEYLKDSFPSLKLTVSTTITKNNIEDISEIESFCSYIGCGLSNTIVVPEKLEDIELLPTLSEQDIYKNIDSIVSTESKIPMAVNRCHAGYGIWSIDPSGDVFPCQSLNYPELSLGNIYYQTIEQILEYRNSNFCIPSVETNNVCNKCDVKYLCGGGCVASGYIINGRKLTHNPLMCLMNRNNALLKLKGLDNRL